MSNWNQDELRIRISQGDDEYSSDESIPDMSSLSLHDVLQTVIHNEEEDNNTSEDDGNDSVDAGGRGLLEQPFRSYEVISLTYGLPRIGSRVTHFYYRGRYGDAQLLFRALTICYHQADVSLDGRRINFLQLAAHGLSMFPSVIFEDFVRLWDSETQNYRSVFFLTLNAINTISSDFMAHIISDRDYGSGFVYTARSNYC